MGGERVQDRTLVGAGVGVHCRYASRAATSRYSTSAASTVDDRLESCARNSLAVTGADELFGRGELDVETRMAGQPRLDRRGLVGAVVVADQVDSGSVESLNVSTQCGFWRRTLECDDPAEPVVYKRDGLGVRGTEPLP